MLVYCHHFSSLFTAFQLNNYERGFQQRIQRVRTAEMKYLRKELSLWACTLILTVLSPVFATASTFIVYVFVDESHTLTASTSFSVLLFFSALRFPINEFGKMIGKAVQAYESTRRLGAFLSRPIRTTKEDDVHHECSVFVENGNFVVGDSNAENVERDIFTLSNINLELKRKEILAVVGPVGCGKSTFINALIGDVVSKPDSVVSMHGKIAFAGQIPFILNDTIRENILFGLEYEQVKYEQVLDACCLRPDLAKIGPAGDLTQIGERGVTLSGGNVLHL